ncbi:MAG: Fur family transcriptional regulator [Pseudomonadota bacterium]|nr:Fur family transcriptional regulator [Pseudomonadota bacterium]
MNRRPSPNLAVVQRLRSVGLQPTRQRLAVAAVMLTRPCHLSADQVIDRLHALQEGAADSAFPPPISRATVYATLAQFARAGLLRELHVGPGPVIYDSNTSRHAHWVDVDTGDVHDLPDNVHWRIEGLDQLPHGLQIQDVQLVVRVKAVTRPENLSSKISPHA